jgi:hypothetical protein
MSLGTNGGADTTYGPCGIANGHAYSLLSAFNMTDANGTVHPVLLVRNPWGLENRYNQSWNSTDKNWTTALIA